MYLLMLTRMLSRFPIVDLMTSALYNIQFDVSMYRKIYDEYKKEFANSYLDLAKRVISESVPFSDVKFEKSCSNNKIRTFVIHNGRRLVFGHFKIPPMTLDESVIIKYISNQLDEICNAFNKRRADEKLRKKKAS